MKNFLRSRDRSSKGAALMIVLAFVVLLAGVALAYFSRTTTDRQLAQSSSNDTSADVFARSALDIVVSDFKQEILAAGTTANSNNIQPQRSGADASIPNLIRRSVFPDNIPAPGLSSLASAVTSAPTDLNNIKRGEITSARWNSHYLIPSGANFTAPNWVLVTRNGPAAFSAWQDNLKDRTSTNTSYVVGRYAFAVYDEGGLLDMSTAGYPGWTNTGGGCIPAPTPWLTNIGRKSSVGFADLTALPGLTQTQIDKTVGWRNYATTSRTYTDFPTADPGFAGTDCNLQDSYGSYLLDFGDPPFSFDSTDQPVPISSYPFTCVFPTTSNTRTDQMLTTRQQLLKFASALGIPQSTLQYMGTFSRERNQPAQDWPNLGNNLSDGRFCFDNFDLVKPNPDISGCTNHGRGKGKSKGKGRGHLCGTQEDIVNLFGLLWIPSTSLPPDPNGNPQPGHWRYIDHNGKSWGNTNPNGKINCFRGANKQNDFFQILHYAFNRLPCAGGQQPGSIARTFAIGASLIDQYDSDTDDLDTTLTGTNAKWQTHTTVIEYDTNTFAYGMEPTSNGSANSLGDCAYTDTNGNYKNHPHRAYGAPNPVGNPIIVDHAFTNVGEFGYGIDTSSPSQPTLNFYQGSSLDKPLLDFFSYNPIDSRYPRAGIVNLNSKNVPVLAAIIKGALTRDGTSSYVSGATATTAAQTIVTTTSAQPALSRADVTRLAEAVGTGIGTTEEEKETISRALAELGQTRTWNLLIDLIAQTGHYGPNAQNLTDFIPEGEKRYWLHIALGRDLINGQVDVLGTQVEEVIE
jgi:hypothetical protein